ncbi:MAG: heavy-metal-associated domain-containing protein [Burkholderiaceae bacterium]|jgi:copper chaperone|nr:heavy-metal-associated domain-containing protein [Burkholderiaceae bacterium]
MEKTIADRLIRRSEMTSAEFQITGMTCGGCEQSVMRIISGIAGVDSVQVDRPHNRATVRWREDMTPEQERIARSLICDAVNASGFDCTQGNSAS